MRIKKLRMSWELFSKLFMAGEHRSTYRINHGEGVPEDAELLEASVDYCNTIVLLVKSESFPSIKEGEAIPYFDVVFHGTPLNS